MKISIPILAKIEVGYQKTTTFIYGVDPVTHDRFIHEYAVKAKAVFDKDLQIAKRALHSALLAGTVAADFTLTPLMFAVLVPIHFVAHVGGVAVRTAAEFIGDLAADVPHYHNERVAAWAARLQKVLNP